MKRSSRLIISRCTAEATLRPAPLPAIPPHRKVSALAKSSPTRPANAHRVCLGPNRRGAVRREATSVGVLRVAVDAWATCGSVKRHDTRGAAAAWRLNMRMMWGAHRGGRKGHQRHLRKSHDWRRGEELGTLGTELCGASLLVVGGRRKQRRMRKRLLLRRRGLQCLLLLLLLLLKLLLGPLLWRGSSRSESNKGVWRIVMRRAAARLLLPRH